MKNILKTSPIFPPTDLPLSSRVTSHVAGELEPSEENRASSKMDQLTTIEVDSKILTDFLNLGTRMCTSALRNNILQNMPDSFMFWEKQVSGNEDNEQSVKLKEKSYELAKMIITKYTLGDKVITKDDLAIFLTKEQIDTI